MLVPVPPHLSFTRLKISPLLHISEIYVSQYTTFSLTQLISISTRSVSIEIPSSSLLSPNEYLYSLDPLSRYFGQPCRRKVSEIHFSLESNESLYFLASCVDNDLDNPGDQTSVQFTFLFSNESIFSTAIVGNDQDIVIHQSE